MQKRFLSSLFVSLFLNFLIKPFSVLVIDAGVQRELGNAVYGKYFTLLSLTVIFNVFLDLGINNYTVRNIAQDEGRIERHLTNILGFRLLLFLLYTVLVLCFAFGFGIAKEQESILLFLILNQFLVQSIALLRSIISGQHRFYLDSALSVLDRALLILIVGWAFLFQRSWITVEYFVIVQAICYLVTLLVSILSIKSAFVQPLLKINWNYIREILRQSLPFALLILLMLIYNRSDILLIRLLSKEGEFDAGIYAQGFRLYDALYMVGMIFTGVLFPMFSRMLHTKDLRLQELVSLSERWLVGGVLSLVFIVIQNADLILSSLYGAHWEPKSSVVLIGLMFAFLAMSFNFIYGTLLTAHGSLASLNRISALAVVLSLGCNFMCIPTYGVLGAVTVAILVQFVVSLMLIITSYQRINLRFSWRNSFSVFCYALFLGLMHLLLSSLPMDYHRLWITIVISIFCIVWFSVIDIKNIFHLFTKKEFIQ